MDDKRAALELQVAKTIAEHIGKEWWGINQSSKCVYRKAAEAAIDLIRAEVERLRAALTPSADTKAAYIGEFHFNEDYMDEDGNYATRKIAVPWTTVKEIMAAILARAALTAQEKTDGK